MNRVSCCRQTTDLNSGDPPGFLASMIVVLGLAILAGCGWSGSDPSGEWYSDWDRSGGCHSPMERNAFWTNGFGEPVDACAWPGEFVWITYAAMWCDTSAKQAPQVADAIRRADGEVRFITTLTGGREVFTDASIDDARLWADRFGLVRALTVTEGQSTRTIPQHALIGPDGRTWFRYVGYIEGDEILELIASFRAGERAPKVF